jgi:hypothetical protein
VNDEGEENQQPDEDTADDQKRREHVQNVSGGPVRVTERQGAIVPEVRRSGCHTSLVDGGATALYRDACRLTGWWSL